MAICRACHHHHAALLPRLLLQAPLLRAVGTFPGGADGLGERALAGAGRGQLSGGCPRQRTLEQEAISCCSSAVLISSHSSNQPARLLPPIAGCHPPCGPDPAPQRCRQAGRCAGVVCQQCAGKGEEGCGCARLRSWQACALFHGNTGIRCARAFHAKCNECASSGCLVSFCSCFATQTTHSNHSSIIACLPFFQPKLSVHPLPPAGCRTTSLWRTPLCCPPAAAPAPLPSPTLAAWRA